MLSPDGSPAVLDDPVVLVGGGVGVVPDDDHRVVDGAAARGVDDARGVRLENGGVDADGDGLLRHGRHQALLIFGLHHLKVADGGVVGRVVVALAVLGGIRGVVGLQSDAALVHDPLHGPPWNAAVAASVLSAALLEATAVVGAVNDLLLGQGHELPRRDGHGALDGAGGGEGPARAALALVLHGGDSVVLAPVDGCRKAGGQQLGPGEVLDGVQELALEAGVLGLELLGAEVGELVQLHVEGSIGVGVVRLDGGKGLFEVGLRGRSLLLAAVHLLVLQGPLLERMMSDGLGVERFAAEDRAR